MEITYKGKSYKSLSALCTQNNVHYLTCYRMVTEKHISVDEAVQILKDGGSFTSVPYKHQGIILREKAFKNHKSHF